jgi:dihydrofolate reductase
MTGEQPAESFTAATSTEQCDAVVMGRTSFDQGFQDWLADWPWPDEQVYILTSRRLPADASAVGVLALRGQLGDTVRARAERRHGAPGRNG